MMRISSSPCELRSYLQLSQCRRSNEGQLEEEEANLEEEGCTPQKGKIRCQHVTGSVDPSQEVDKVIFFCISVSSKLRSQKVMFWGLCRFLPNVGLVKNVGKSLRHGGFDMRLACHWNVARPFASRFSSEMRSKATCKKPVSNLSRSKHTCAKDPERRFYDSHQ